MDDTKKFQTLSQFLKRPFGISDPVRGMDYEKKYQTFLSKNKISVMGLMVLDECYYIHVKVPSESRNDQYYDVVIKFFTDDIRIKRELMLTNYFVHFFSNCPSFIYQFATLYRLEGVLIESLQNKLDQKGLATLPEKTNKENKLSYDKSIYMACRFLEDHRLQYLTKSGLILQRRMKLEIFLKNIQSFQDITAGLSIAAIEKSLKKEQEWDKKKSVTNKSNSKVVKFHHIPSMIKMKNKKLPKIGKKKAVRSTIKSRAK